MLRAWDMSVTDTLSSARTEIEQGLPTRQHVHRRKSIRKNSCAAKGRGRMQQRLQLNWQQLATTTTPARCRGSLNSGSNQVQTLGWIRGGGGRISISRTWVQPRFNPGSTQVQSRLNPGSTQFEPTFSLGSTQVQPRFSGPG